MKVGDIIRYREAWVRDEESAAAIPRTDAGGWSPPVLVVGQFPPPDEALFIALENSARVVVSEQKGLTEVEVLSEG